MKSNLEIRDLSVAVAGRALFQDFALMVVAGERVAITGPSGSGKTTLLRAVCGLSDAASGTVLLDGKTGDEWGWPAFRRRVTLVEQRPTLREATVEENLRLPFTYRSASGEFPGERAAEWLGRVGLRGMDWQQEARSLSVGQQQRLCLVRALLLEPAVLLLDEPTSALDADAAVAVEGLLIEECERRGLACLVVTHSAEQVDRFCTRRVCLSDFSPTGAGDDG